MDLDIPGSSTPGCQQWYCAALDPCWETECMAARLELALADPAGCGAGHAPVRRLRRLRRFWHWNKVRAFCFRGPLRHGRRGARAARPNTPQDAAAGPHIADAAASGIIVSIPLYSAAGNRLDTISCHELARLQACGRIARVVRRRDGSPVRAYLLPRDGLESPGYLTAYMGQRYSYQQQLVNCRVWSLRRLGRGAELRPVFWAVLKSCLRPADGSGKDHGREPYHHHPAAGFVPSGISSVNTIRPS